MSSRFTRSPRWLARLILAATFALIIAGLVLPARTPPTNMPRLGVTHDVDLYRAITARVAANEPYYHAVAAQHRAMGYPLKPFVTVRPPLLAVATAWAGTDATRKVLRGLVLVTLIALALRLSSVTSGATRIIAIAIAIPTVGILNQPGSEWHEAWAAVLVTLALALHRPSRWWPSVAIALAAALTRELAIPFLLVMGAAALFERRRGEAAGWGAAVVVAAVALAIHAAHVAAVVLPSDRASQGWAGGGWTAVLSMLSSTSILTLVPATAVAVLVPLALLGWAGLRSPLGLRPALWTGGMAATFAVVGRADNFYWGLMLAPLLPIGLAFAPLALRDLGRAAR